MLYPIELLGHQAHYSILLRREQEIAIGQPAAINLIKSESPGVGGTRQAISGREFHLPLVHQHGGDMLTLLQVVRHQIPVKFLRCHVDNIHHICHIFIKIY